MGEKVYLWEVLLGFVFAVILVLVFLIQKRFFRRYYFGFGELIIGIQASVGIKGLLVRAIIVYLYCFFISLFFSSLFLTCYSVILGAVLIIWPSFLKPKIVDYRLRKKRGLLLSFYAVFVIFCGLIGVLSAFTVSLLKPDIVWFFTSFSNTERRVTAFGDLILSLIGLYVLRKIAGGLNKLIKSADKSRERA